jgi:iron complex transport system substrate-binding protein
MAARKMRIVSLVPSATEILYRLGAAKSLVAATRWCKNVVPASVVRGLPLYDDCWSADPAKVAALRPDLVIGGVPYRTEVVNGLLARGLRFLATSPRTIDDIYGDVRTIAGIVGREKQGERVIAAMRRAIQKASRQAAKAQREMTQTVSRGGAKAQSETSPRAARIGPKAPRKPRLYCEVWPNPLRTCEAWVEEMVRAAGGEFVPQPAGRRVTSEEVMAANPEIVVLAWAATGNRARPEVARKRPGWNQVTAVRENRIHVVRDEWLNTPSPVLVRGLEALTAIIHPRILSAARARPGRIDRR